MFTNIELTDIMINRLTDLLEAFLAINNHELFENAVAVNCVVVGKTKSTVSFTNGSTLVVKPSSIEDGVWSYWDISTPVRVMLELPNGQLSMEEHYKSIKLLKRVLERLNSNDVEPFTDSIRSF